MHNKLDIQPILEAVWQGVKRLVALVSPLPAVHYFSVLTDPAGNTSDIEMLEELLAAKFCNIFFIFS